MGIYIEIIAELQLDVNTGFMTFPYEPNIVLNCYSKRYPINFFIENMILTARINRT